MMNLEAVTEPQHHAAMLGFSSIYNMMHGIHYRTGFSSIQIAKENIGNMYFAFTFKPRSPIVNQINLKAQQLQESGITTRILKKVMRTRRFLHHPLPSQPQILTIDHLHAGALIRVGLYALSFAVFLVEIGKKSMKRIAIHLLGSIVVLSLTRQPYLFRGHT
jgi:hypothetical protein